VPKWSSSGGEDEGAGAGAARREGEVFIFSNGSFVCWGLGEEDAKRFRRDVLTPARAEVGPLDEPETEELEFATDPSECVNTTSFVYLRDRTSNKTPFVFFGLFVLCVGGRDYRET
jgi:uncharacterized Rmd1/YagE family protein